MPDLNREEFYRALDSVTTAVREGNTRIGAALESMGVTLVEHGEAIAAIKAVMDEREKQANKDVTARWTAVGSGVAAILSGAFAWWNK